MILKTKNFQEVVNKILVAVSVDKAAANLELAAKDTKLYLRVTNREYYCAVGFDLETPTEFRAVVDANLFLNLISGISTEEFALEIKENFVVVKAGKSSSTSVASTLLTTEALVTDIKEPQPLMAPPAGGMDY